jgi:hypothetical protein
VSGTQDDDQVVVEVILPEASPSIYALQFTLNYPDDALQTPAWQRGAVAPVQDTTIFQTGPGTLRFAAFDQSPWGAGGGVVMRVVFATKDSQNKANRKLLTISNLHIFTDEGHEVVAGHQVPGSLSRNPDNWIADVLGSSADPEQDADHDGFSNRKEYAAGTDPHDPMSRFAISSFSNDLGNQSQRLKWRAAFGVRYRLTLSENLNDWQPVPEAELIGNDGDVEIELQPPAAAKRLFYRVEVVE